MATREQIWAALFTKLQTQLSPSGPFITMDRRLRDWEAISPNLQPYLGLQQLREHIVRDKVRPRIMTLHGHIVIYARVPDYTTAGGSIINPLLDAVETALAPDVWDAPSSTLGGLVNACWIEGDVIISEGVQDDQAVAIMPVTIIAP